MRFSNSFFSGLKFISVFCCLLILTSSIYSQSYRVRTYTAEDGLPTSTVSDVAQDASGRIWFATRSGIVAYDGSSWRVYTIAHGLPGLDYFKIKFDGQGKLWALTRFPDVSVLCLEGEDWISLPPLPESEKGVGYITSFEVAAAKGRTTLAVGTSRAGLYIWADEQWKHLTPKEGLLSLSVNSLAAQEGKFYVATDKGLSVVADNKVDNSLNRFIQSPSSDITGIAVGDDIDRPSTSGRVFTIWLLGKDWLATLRDKSFQLLSTKVKIAPSHSYPLALQPDLRGGIYYGNPDTIFHFDRKTGMIKHLGKENGLIAEGATSIFFDREKNLWIVGWRGVSKISSMRFANYRKEHGLLEDEVTAVCELDSGVMVFGHNNGLSFFDGVKFRKLIFSEDDYPSITEKRVLDMRKDSQRNIWAAVSSLGVARIDPRGEISWLKETGFSRRSFSSVFIDKANNLWAGGLTGLFIVENGKLRQVKVSQSKDIAVRRIFQAPDGAIFLATPSSGLFVYNQAQWKHYFNAKEQAANSIYSVLHDSQGKVWVGASAGLFSLKNGALERVDTNGFQIDRPVYFIIEDKKGRLWFGTDFGVVRWDGQQSRGYAVREGLAGQETNRAAGFVDSQGRIWIGTERGVSCYQEEFDQFDVPPPLVELAALEVSGEKFSIQRLCRLYHHQNNLVFHFRGISFIDESGVRYKSWLEGFDEHWSPEYRIYDQQLRYTNLPPGRYRFRLKAKNAEGVWSEEVSSSEIIIQKPFWKETWFYLVSFLFVGFILYGIQRFFSERRLSLLLKKQVMERTAQFQESEKKYRALVETAQEGITVADAEENIIFANESFGGMLGYRKEELIGLNLSKICDKEWFDRFRKETMSRQSGKSSRYETVLHTKSGEARRFEVSACPLYDDAKNFIGTLALLSDITERKMAEEELKTSLREKVVLLQEIHHRVKNNLQIISSLLNLQAGYIKDSNVREMFDASRSRVRSMALIHEMLYKSRDFSKIDLAEYIRNLTSSLFDSYKINSSLVTLKVNIKDVDLDINKLIPCGLVITELVSNSLKHAFPERKKGQLSIELHPDKNGKFILAVADNGIGFPKDLDFRNTNSLGMRLVCILTQQLGGTMRLDREGGTTFTITF